MVRFLAGSMLALLLVGAGLHFANGADLIDPINPTPSKAVKKKAPVPVKKTAPAVPTERKLATAPKSAPTVTAEDSPELKAALDALSELSKPSAPAVPTTHELGSPIHISSSDNLALRTICLDAKGNLIVALGLPKSAASGMKSGAGAVMGEVRILSPDGKKLHSWTLDFVPQSAAVSPQGTIFVGGGAKVSEYAADGKLIRSSGSPQISLVKSKEAEVRTEFAASQKSTRGRYDEMIATAKKAEERESDETRRKTLVMRREAIEKIAKQSDENFDAQFAAYLEGKFGVNGLAVTEKDVYVACRSTIGYSFAIWRMGRDLKDGVPIVKDLSGCCGQLGIGCCGKDLYVAENSRFRVRRFDREGREISSWGKKESRTSNDGFGSCCNPMNLWFSPEGDVYTSESSVGRLRRYKPSGEFVAELGSAKVSPGCKNVSIGVSASGDRAYMADIDRNQIFVFRRKGPVAASTSPNPRFDLGSIAGAAP